MRLLRRTPVGDSLKCGDHNIRLSLKQKIDRCLSAEPAVGRTQPLGAIRRSKHVFDKELQPRQLPDLPRRVSARDRAV